MKLSLDTTQTNIITVDLDADEVQKENHFGSQVLLPAIEELLDKHKKSIKDLDSIVVAEGPGGSFTGTRVGIAVANALAYGLKIPVNNLPIGEYAEPKYNL